MLPKFRVSEAQPRLPAFDFMETVNLFGKVDIGKLLAIRNHSAREVESAEKELIDFEANVHPLVAVAWHLMRFHGLTAALNQARLALLRARAVLLKFEISQREVSLAAFKAVVDNPFPSGVVCTD